MLVRAFLFFKREGKMKSKKFKLSAIVFYSVIIALALVLPNMAFATPVPDTGQTKCYNNTVEIPCPQPGSRSMGRMHSMAPTRTHTPTLAMAL